MKKIEKEIKVVRSFFEDKRGRAGTSLRFFKKILSDEDWHFYFEAEFSNITWLQDVYGNILDFLGSKDEITFTADEFILKYKDIIDFDSFIGNDSLLEIEQHNRTLPEEEREVKELTEWKAKCSMQTDEELLERYVLEHKKLNYSGEERSQLDEIVKALREEGLAAAQNKIARSFLNPNVAVEAQNPLGNNTVVCEVGACNNVDQSMQLIITYFNKEWEIIKQEYGQPWTLQNKKYRDICLEFSVGGKLTLFRVDLHPEVLFHSVCKYEADFKAAWDLFIHNFDVKMNTKNILRN